MSVRVTIIEGPLPRPEHATDASGLVGAGVVFDGVVRAEEGDATIAALEYEAYRPMADHELERLARRMLDKHGLLAIDVWHSVGTVPVGAVSFRLDIRSAHREEALAAMDEFIDAMKRDVPIWKRAMSRLPA
ncbi:MAG: molybdenum cofactor biosynthesis protein MoaE [Phycisphaeraceae bacterium]|nr:molybdenum cofactor biosynthesis protein MoaE [Phycisphaeraceae bacterium]